jgi:hypothetical protein
MEKSSKRGKIPQSDWPLIMARYEAGETLSSIARTYDCSPPAISYVVSRSRARQPDGGAPRPTPAGESQLIKSAGNGAEPASHREPATSPANAPAEVVLPHPASLAPMPEAAPVHASATPPQAAAPGEPRSEIRPGHGTSHGTGNSNGVEQPRWIDRAPQSSDPRASDPRTSEPRTAAELFARSPVLSPARPSELQSAPQPAHAAANGDQHRPAPHASANGDPRGRLHLSLGNGNGSHPNGGSHPAEPRLPERQAAPPLQHPSPQHPAPQHPSPQHSAPNSGGERPSWAAPASQHQPAAAEQPYRPASPNQHPAPAHNAASPTGSPGHANGAHAGNPEPRKEAGGSYIDRELRARVDADIAAFLAAFDGALAADTPDSRTALREATDRLLRAGARTRIELERLEARLPLPPRDTGRQGEPAWRQR